MGTRGVRHPRVDLAHEHSAVKNYLARIEDHKKTYETMNTSGGPFVKIYNVGERLVVHNIQGYLQSRIIFYLMNISNRVSHVLSPAGLTVQYRTIWFARSGQSLIEHAYKADSDLSPQGIEYAEKLRRFIIEKRRELQEERTKINEDFEERDLTVRHPRNNPADVPDLDVLEAPLRLDRTAPRLARQDRRASADVRA